jgi:hypothetical protein
MPAFQKTKILVLGSTHLGALGDKFKPKFVDKLIETLKRFEPDLICIENLPGEVIERMQLSDEEDLERFAGHHLRFAKS